MHAPPQNLPSLVGRIFGNQFRLEALLGRGGMGEVYLAEQLELGRRVVLKLLLYSQQWSSPELEERFRREARVLAQLNHPNIVQLYSFGRTEDGISYLAMEYIDGHTLTATIRERGALPELLVLSMLDQICSALVEAHRHGIVHRDLKPDNVMTMDRYGQPAFVKVLDFGIAKLTRVHAPRLTQSGAILGTPQYIAPEQLREEPVDERTDIYALGLIGYELLTGEVPFVGDNTMDLMMRVLNDEPIPPSRKSHGGHVSAATEALIVRCLAKDREQRFQTSIELRDALAAIPRGTAAQSEQPEPQRVQARDTWPSLSLDMPEHEIPHVSRVRRRRARTLATAIAVLLGLLVVVGGVGWLASANITGTELLDGVATQPQSNGARGSEAAPLQLREWVQGMPFPQGTDYDGFEATYVDARVAASEERVLAFYRLHIREKWGAFEERDGELIVTNPDAPIDTLTVTADEKGSRLFIKRRDERDQL
jgi:serine/threonine protein kinase